MSQEQEYVPLQEIDEAPPARVVAALDASRHSLAALRAAAELAVLLEAELQGLYVEDIELIRLSGLPFSYELGSFSATRRRLDNASVERDFRLMAQRMRRAVAQTAVTARVKWSFQVTRGSVTSEILAAAEAAEVLTLGRVGRTPGRQMGSTARRIMQQAMRPVFLLGDEGLTLPLTVLHTGSPASERALALAATIMLGHTAPLQLVVINDPTHAADEREHRAKRCVEQLESQELAADLYLLDRAEEFLGLQGTIDPGTLILPGDLAIMLEALNQSAILVP